jgi:hypothetical protein
MRFRAVLLIGVGTLAMQGCPNSLAPHQVGLGGGGGSRALAFLVQPSTAHSAAFITPAVQVAVEDTLGVVDTTFSGGVTMTLGNNTTQAVLSGTTTVVLVSGVASFSDLTINNVGAGYTLNAASAGLTTVGSTSFDIIP